jgi:hypothetical protein
VNLPVAGVMHQPEMREVLRPAVTLGLHVVDVDRFPWADLAGNMSMACVPRLGLRRFTKWKPK